MKIIKGVSIFTTVINGIMSVFSMLIAMLCYLFLSNIGQFTSDSLDSLKSIEDNGVVAGYEVLARFGDGILGIIGDLILVVAVLCFVVLAVCFLIPTVFGIVVNAKSRKRLEDVLAYANAYKNDALVKIVLNGFPIGLITLMSISSLKDIVNHPGLVLFWIILTGLSVFQYVKAKRILAQDIN